MKLKSFGCSFIYGSDLEDQKSTWPCLVSGKLGLDYECYARPGSGNLQILESVLRHSRHDKDSFFLINWTWIDRFDFISVADESWQTLRPSLDHENADYYYRHFHSQYRDMLTNLSWIKTASDTLRQQGIKSIMTYMDYLLFESVNPNWHEPSAVEYLQNETRPCLVDFSGKNFLDWSRDQKFAVSDRWHPLEDAHKAAADFMLPTIEKLLG